MMFFMNRAECIQRVALKDASRNEETLAAEVDRLARAGMAYSAIARKLVAEPLARAASTRPLPSIDQLGDPRAAQPQDVLRHRAVLELLSETADERPAAVHHALELWLRAGGAMSLTEATFSAGLRGDRRADVRLAAERFLLDCQQYL